MGTNTLLLPQSWHFLGHVTTATPPTPSLSLQLFLSLEEFASIEEADREGVPAGALQVVAQDCATSSISSVEGQSANEATEKEEWPMEKPGLGWRKADGEVC